MEVIRDPEFMARMRIAFELSETGFEMMRQNLRRRYPDACEEEITERLRLWLLNRPGAEHGDGEGVAVPVKDWLP